LRKSYLNAVTCLAQEPTNSIKQSPSEANSHSVEKLPAFTRACHWSLSQAK